MPLLARNVSISQWGEHRRSPVPFPSSGLTSKGDEVTEQSIWHILHWSHSGLEENILPSLWLWGINKTTFALQDISVLRSLYLRKNIFYSFLCENRQFWSNCWAIQQKILTCIKGCVSDPRLVPWRASWSQSQNLQCVTWQMLPVLSLLRSCGGKLFHTAVTVSKGEGNTLSRLLKESSEKQTERAQPHPPPSGLITLQYSWRRALPCLQLLVAGENTSRVWVWEEVWWRWGTRNSWNGKLVLLSI